MPYMNESSSVLRLRVLLCLLADNNSAKSVTGISKTLGLPKYTITRALAAMEKEGLVDRKNQRLPLLTYHGLLTAKKYEERINIAASYLMHEGESAETAHLDAVYWAIYGSDESIKAAKKAEERRRLKYSLGEKKRFSGELFCRQLADGSYDIPFVIYSESTENMSNISNLNGCFDRLCTLRANGKNSVFLLRATTDPNGSEAYIKALYYAENGELIRSEKNGNVYSFPASPFSFIRLGTKNCSVLHGSIYLKIQYTNENASGTEATVLFTIIL